MLDISIVIVSWNTEDYLRKCLKSIYATTKTISYEIIVVDNNSSDGSVKMIKEEFPDVNLICLETNLGFGKANNIGIRESTGQFICLVNSDVEVLDNSLDLMYSYMNDHQSIGVLGPKTLNSDMSLQQSFEGFPTIWRLLCRALYIDRIFPRSKIFAGSTMTYFNDTVISNVDILFGSFWLINRTALNEVGLLDEDYFMYAEDKDWCKRFNKAGWDVVYYPDTQIIHHGGQSSSNAPIRFLNEQLYSNVLYWKKHHNRLTRISLMVITMLHFTIRIIGWGVQYLIFPTKKKNLITRITTNLSALQFFKKLIVSSINRSVKFSISLIYYISLSTRNNLYRLLNIKPQGTLVVLCYHGILSKDKNNFIRQMDLLKKIANPINTDLKNYKPGMHNIVITFDDGFQNVMDNAYSVLINKNIPFTFFITYGCLGQCPEWITNKNNRNIREILISEDTLESLKNKHVIIGSHSVTHPRLTLIDKEKAKHEIFQSKHEIEKIINKKVEVFAFPFDDFNDECVDLTKQAGYTRVFTGQASHTNSNKDDYIIGRIAAEPYDGLLEFRLKVVGAYNWIPIVCKLKNLVKNMKKDNNITK